ncbi:hypothetical protein K7X08_030473 [Anisodus acutangulus]|uniref:Uncharacterized protein n=1 Tax=Anisodus acutangulus TaxID=402998 RepID=A0A9Q1L4Y0_9SOLA|nr:hypothetical protein K7X08_030473 [Anisodus acutangulus]
MQTRAVVVEKRIEKSLVPVNIEVQQQTNTTPAQDGASGTVIDQVSANVVTPTLGTLKPLPPTAIMVTPMYNPVFDAAPVPAQRKLDIQGSDQQGAAQRKGHEKQAQVWQSKDRYEQEKQPVDNNDTVGAETVIEEGEWKKEIGKIRASPTAIDDTETFNGFNPLVEDALH